MRLSALLAHKGGQPVTIAVTATVADAVRTMYENQVGSVIIADTQGLPSGIFTERDVLRLCALGKGGDLDELAIKEFMTQEVITGSPDDRIDEVMGLMTERRFRRLPILKDGELIGLVSIGDLVKAKLHEIENEAQSLREYISS